MKSLCNDLALISTAYAFNTTNAFDQFRSESVLYRAKTRRINFRTKKNGTQPNISSAYSKEGRIGHFYYLRNEFVGTYSQITTSK